MLLAGDQWSEDGGFYGEDDHFPIARTAVDALTDLAPLPKTDAQKLFEIGTGSRDQDLRLAADRHRPDARSTGAPTKKGKRRRVRAGARRR